jgi:hypothetical protein
MFYLFDEEPCSNFLVSIVCFLLPLSTMDSDCFVTPVPSSMDPQPLNRPSPHTHPVLPHAPPLLPTPPDPPRSMPPSTSKPSIQPSTSFGLDLVKPLEALQVSSHAAPSSSRQAEESLATQFNLILMVADPLGTARAISEHTAREELTIP